MLLRLMRTYLRHYRGSLVLIVIFQFCQTLAMLYLPTLNADVIDKGIGRGDTDYIWRIGGLMLAITVAQVAFAICAVYLASRTAMAFGRDVRSGLFHRVTDFSAREVNSLGAPSLITRITNDVTQVQLVTLMVCMFLVTAPIMAIGGVVMALRKDAGLSTILVVSVPVLGVALGSIVGRMVPQFRLMQDRIDGVNRVLREQITGMRVVRAFVREPDESRRFDEVNEDLTAVSLRAGHLIAMTFPTVFLVLNLSSVATLWLGADRISDGASSLGSMVAFLTYLIQILMAVMMATFMASMIPRASVCAGRINEVLDTPSSVGPPAVPVDTFPERGSVEFRNVSFHYPGADEPVLEDITFRSCAGETTAFIGSTGSGKTTLVNLVPRLFDATGGTLLVDGVDVRDVHPDVIRERIGLVPQRPYLFSGTVASNLRDGKPDATDEEMWAALEVAQAKDFVAAMPGGLQAPIAQGGTNVSGGQRQRLSIARALIRKPEIYVFDDSFSALDLMTDARLRAALRPHTTDATVLIVAQRVSTIRDADRIVVLEDGRSVGVGTHEELLRTCPTYAEIVASQHAERDDAA